MGAIFHHAEPFDKLRQYVKRLVATPFREPWQFLIEVDGQPADFDLMVKGVSFGPYEVDTGEVKIGNTILTYPESSQPVGVSMTLRDHEDSRVYKWIGEHIGKMLNKDGTVNPPGDYLINVRRFLLTEGGTKSTQIDEWRGFFKSVANVEESNDNDGHQEIQVEFIQFRSM